MPRENEEAAFHRYCPYMLPVLKDHPAIRGLLAILITESVSGKYKLIVPARSKKVLRLHQRALIDSHISRQNPPELGIRY